MENFRHELQSVKGRLTAKRKLTGCREVSCTLGETVALVWYSVIGKSSLLPGLL